MPWPHGMIRKNECHLFALVAYDLYGNKGSITTMTEEPDLIRLLQILECGTN